MDIEIVDNFIKREKFQEIKNTILGPFFPWYYNPSIIDPINDVDDKRFQDFQFIHTFYKFYSPQSPYIDLINPLIEKINPISIVRIKANLNTYKNENFLYGMHVDYNFPEVTSAIFYINSNNGNTVFENGMNVEAVENRIVFFNSSIKHSGTSCTDQKTRCVINFNFIKEKAQ